MNKQNNQIKGPWSPTFNALLEKLREMNPTAASGFIVQETKEKECGVCSWCRFEYDPGTFERTRLLADEEYGRLSKDPGVSHGCCRLCGEQQLAQCEAYRTECNAVDLDRDKAKALDRAAAQDLLGRAIEELVHGGGRQAKFTGPTNGRAPKPNGREA